MPNAIFLRPLNWHPLERRVRMTSPAHALFSTNVSAVWAVEVVLLVERTLPAGHQNVWLANTCITVPLHKDTGSIFSIVGTKLCVPCPLEVKDGLKGWKMGGVADKWANTVHSLNVISQRQYFVASCLSFGVSNVFGLHSIWVCYPSICKLLT
jgi:hypothetical protein